MVTGIVHEQHQTSNWAEKTIYTHTADEIPELNADTPEASRLSTAADGNIKLDTFPVENSLHSMTES